MVITEQPPWRTVTYYPEAVELKGTVKYDKDEGWMAKRWASAVFIRED